MDFLVHRNVPEDLKKSIERQLKYASARAPHQYAGDDVFQVVVYIVYWNSSAV